MQKQASKTFAAWTYDHCDPSAAKNHVGTFRKASVLWWRDEPDHVGGHESVVFAVTTLS